MTSAELVQIVVIFVLSLLSSLVTTIAIQRRLKAKKLPIASIGGNADRAVRALQDLGKAITFPSVEPDDYPDKDKDGVPDAFQRRRPLSEILEFDKQPGDPGDADSPGRFSSRPNEYWIAVELPPRPPRKYEYFMYNGRLLQAASDFCELPNPYNAIIIKHTRNCRPEDLVELTK